MKKLIISIATLFFALNVGIAQPKLPNDIEEKIERAFVASFQDKDVLQNLITEMENKYGQASDEARYWLAYAYYQNTIVEMQVGKKKLAKNAIEKSISILEDDDNKDSEDLALLSSAIGLSINFSAWKAPFLGIESESLAKEAIELDNNNMRAYLAIGRSSYYKPAMFGGGEEVEEMMLKVISLPKTSQKSAVQPYWGKAEAYYLLSKFYQQENRQEEAFTYSKKGLKEFPDNKRLQNLVAKLSENQTTAGR